ncbi:glycosyltransferase [Candidatus Omnitrophus magneticus]|uniref:Glycosyltransferase n=1 Tax=Candidatus Omnitrophus magneticus TaxID=1609969 RepID=A0A0F0CRV6_9BACT|nr:glycosyltransferase [Candidatus Omnitrophus magneticus]
MKVLLLTSHLEVGGIGIYTVDMAKYLKKYGIDVIVASSGGLLARRLDIAGIRHFYLDINGKNEFGFKMLRALPIVIKFIKEEGIDILHAQTRITQVLSSLSGFFTRKKVVTTCHGFFNHHRLSRKLYPAWGDSVIAISSGVTRHLINDLKVPRDRVNLVYNGVDIKRYGKKTKKECAYAVRDHKFDINKITIGSVGRFSIVKGHKFLIEAFALLYAERKDIQLLLIGKGEEEINLMKLARELLVDDKIIFSSGINAPLEDYISLIDIFVLPSISEGFGIALVEAMASLCACVASNTAGPSEIIVREESGIIVETKNSSALKDALLRVINDDKLRKYLAFNAQRRAVENFDIEETVKNTIKVYKNVLAVGGNKK